MATFYRYRGVYNLARGSRNIPECNPLHKTAAAFFGRVSLSHSGTSRSTPPASGLSPRPRQPTHHTDVGWPYQITGSPNLLGRHPGLCVMSLLHKWRQITAWHSFETTNPTRFYPHAPPNSSLCISNPLMEWPNSHGEPQVLLFTEPSVTLLKLASLPYYIIHLT